MRGIIDLSSRQCLTIKCIVTLLKITVYLKNVKSVTVGFKDSPWRIKVALESRPLDTRLKWSRSTVDYVNLILYALQINHSYPIGVKRNMEAYSYCIMGRDKHPGQVAASQIRLFVKV